MYRCERCGRVAPAGTRAHVLVTESRETTYPHRPKANLVRQGRKHSQVDDPGGSGEEIATEVIVCPSCARSAQADAAAEKAFEQPAAPSPP